ncbi:MAG: hypothetical protein J6V69_02525 [Clostridia bacterium]|nr:hypothetical protein [Clostridia bacterium]
MKWFRVKKNKALDSKKLLEPSQAERICALKTEIALLEKRIAEYESREKEIREVLTFAKERAEEYEQEAKIRFILEKERLSAYREKWQRRLEKLNDADRLGEEILECNEYFKKISTDLKKIIDGEKVDVNEVEETYVSEKKRLREMGVSTMQERVLSEEDLNKLLLQFNG